jgi:fibronectin type 3 domain-containing protein
LTKHDTASKGELTKHETASKGERRNDVAQHSFTQIRYKFAPLLIFVSLTMMLITPFALAAPPSSSLQLIAIAVTTGEIDLSWSASSDAGVTAYAIRRNGQMVDTVNNSTFMYTDTSVQSSSVYTYIVEALDATGKRLASSPPAMVKTPALPETPDTTAPSAPEALTATSIAAGILLDWYDATDDSDLTAYRIYRDGRLLATVDSGTRSYIDPSALPGSTPTYTVEALDTVGHRSPPAQAGAHAPASLVAAPPRVGQPLAASPAVAAVTYSPNLKRYPYLTDVVDKYATINWATDRSSTKGSVKWGQVAADGSCTPATTVSATRTFISVNSVGGYQWKAMLSNLLPNTKYCYRVYLSSTDLLDSNASPQFWTQLPAGATQSFSFVVFGDWGSVDDSGNNPDQANLMQQIAASGARFAITTGDNAYPSGSQANYGDLVQVGTNLSGVFGPPFWTVAGATIPVFPAIGNHGFSRSETNHPHLLNWPQDRAVAGSNGKYVKETFCCLNDTTSGSYPSTWYALDAGNARFYVLTAAWTDTNVGTADAYKNDYDYHWTPSSAQYQWLENDLKNHSSALKFAIFHYPLYSDDIGEPSDPYLQGAGSLEGLLGKYGVNMVFNGHTHLYQRNKPNANGLVSYVTGGGGAKLASPDNCSSIDAYAIGWSFTANGGAGGGKACGSATTPTAQNQIYHFLLVGVNGTQVSVTPTDELGRTFDVQTYNFTVADSTPPSAPTNLSASAASATQVNLSWTAATDNIGVTGYEIYRNGALLTTTGAQTSYADTTVAASTSYQYQVKARDAASNLSGFSNTATVTTPAAGTSTTLTFSAEADAYVDATLPTTNFGAASRLYADLSPNQQSYLRFSVSGVSGTVQSAKLRLYAGDGTANGPQLFAASTTWTESEITWNTKPATSGAASDDKDAISSGAWVEFNVTPLVSGNGAYSFALAPMSSDGLSLYSREAATTANRPQLVVTQITP